MTTRTTITIILILLLTTTAHAENADPIIQLQNTIIQENIKTRTELTKYADAKFQQYDEKIQSEVKPFIDENFKRFDDNMHRLATQFIFQFTLSLIFAIILANAVWYWIKRTIEKIRINKTTKTLRGDTLTATQYGLITPEYQAKITREDQTIIKKPQFKETPNQPTPPSIQQIELMLEARRIAKIEAENKKKQEEIMRLQAKAEAKTKKIKQKIQEITKTIEILPPTPPQSVNPNA